MRSPHIKKYLGLAAILLALVLVPTVHVLAQTPPVAPATTPDFISCTTSPVTCGVYYIALTINSILTLFVALGAFVVRLGLQFNDNIYNSPAVQVGFSMTLSIANLGFVLGIIVIAIATIIRNQTYGIKQLLWKLIVMAILVNFGLVLTAPIVGFANSMSNYFINATSPSASTGGYEGYVLTMTQAFGPQSMSTPPPTTNSGSGGTTIGGALVTATCNTFTFGLCSAYTAMKKLMGPSDDFMQQTIAMVYGIVFTSLTAFTFLCLGVLLIVRYLMLAGLLIVLPLAWLMFIFPKFDNNFSKWWNNFIKWTFFPPLALFFIYLAFITAGNLSAAGGGASGSTVGGTGYLAQAAGLPSGSAQGVEGGILHATGLINPIQQAADEILLVGLTVMGLMFASSLSGKAGSTVVNTAASGGKAAGRYLGKQTKKGARATFNAAGGRKAVTAMREGRLPLNLQKAPLGVGWAASRAASLAGRAAEPHLTNKAIVDAAKKKVPENLEQVKQNLKGNMNTEDQLAHLAKLIEKGELSKDTMVGKETAAEFLDKNPNMVTNYDFKKNADDADKVLGNDKVMREAVKGVGVAQLAVKNEEVDATEKLNEAMETLNTAAGKFVDKLKKEDMAKMNASEALATDSPMARALARNIALRAPQLAASVIPKLKSGKLKEFKDLYTNEIKSEQFKYPHFIAMQSIKDQMTDLKKSNKTDKEKTDGLKALQTDMEKFKSTMTEQERNLEFASNSFKTAMGSNATFGTPEVAPNASATPATPAPGH